MQRDTSGADRDVLRYVAATETRTNISDWEWVSYTREENGLVVHHIFNREIQKHAKIWWATWYWNVEICEYRC